MVSNDPGSISNNIKKIKYDKRSDGLVAKSLLSIICIILLSACTVEYYAILGCCWSLLAFYPLPMNRVYRTLFFSGTILGN